ncbi:MAG: DNA polymerase IV [Bryobacter sp.]|nr:DNA polymerase IV [Bryobacter sp.]
MRPRSLATVVHFDADSFFASIEQAADRRLRHRPLAVAGPRRSVVLSASAEARAYGLRPGLPLARARRICPPLTVLPPHFDLYEQFSDQILCLCEERTPLVEEASAGAAWLDLQGTSTLLGPPLGVAEEIRRITAEWLRVPLSFGLATNKLVARVAARLHKPHAPRTIPPGQEAAFLAPLPLRALPGLSRESVEMLSTAGVKRIGHLAQAPLDGLQLLLGKNALLWQRRAQGLDGSPVGAVHARADARSAEPTWREAVEFAEDAWETAKLHAVLRQLLESLMPRLREEGIAVRRLTLGLRYTDREENEYSLTLAEPTNLEADLYVHLPGLLRSAWHRRVRLRALWLRASRPHTPDPQLSLFAPPPSPRREKEERLAAALDHLKKHFGATKITRGCPHAA